MTLTATSTLPAPAAAAAECDARLRQARQLLDAGQLALASAAGWQAAQSAMSAYAANDGATVNAGFTDSARQLVKHRQVDGRAAEWIVSALALSDNAQYDWLDREGVARRLDDVQRLTILVQDIANRPPTAADLLRQAWQCMANGSLPVASEKGWQAALVSTKTYADAVGCDYRGEYHFEAATRLLTKHEVGGREVVKWESGALNLRENAAYCTVYPHWLNPEMVSGDIAGVAKLAAVINESMRSEHLRRHSNV